MFKFDSVQFVYTVPTSLSALDLFNLSLKCLEHIVCMYGCDPFRADNFIKYKTKQTPNIIIV